LLANLHIDFRQKGCCGSARTRWISNGAYSFQNPSSREEEFAIQLPFPAQQAVYDNVQLLLDDKRWRSRQRIAGGLGGRGWPPAQRPCCARHIARKGSTVGRYTFARENADGSGKEISQARDFHFAGENGFFRFRFPGQFAFADGETADGERLGAGVELSEPGVRIRHRLEDAAEAATRSAGGTHQLFSLPYRCSSFSFWCLILSALRAKRFAPDELFLSGMRILCISSPAGVPGDHTIDSFGVRDFVDRFHCAGGQLLAVGGGLAIRGGGDAGLTQLIYLVLFSYAFFFEGFTGLA